VSAGIGLAVAYMAVVTPFAGRERPRHEQELDDWFHEHLTTGWRRWVAYPDMEPEEGWERLKLPHGPIEYGADDVFVLVIEAEGERRFELVVDGEPFGTHPLAGPDADGVQRSEFDVGGRAIRVAVLRGRWATVDMLPRAAKPPGGP
jgi:hypothetical protein